MPEFINLRTPDDALGLMLASIPQSTLSSEVVDTIASLDRVTANNIIAPYALPSFTRSSVDGFAVKASDTFGASDGMPVYFPVVGEILMGSVPKYSLLPTQSVLIHTGGMLPDGADAVVMV